MPLNNDHTIKLKDGRTLGYAEFGDPKGKPVFFLHGWPGCRFHALNIDEAAKEARVRVISPDRPGYGLSDFQPNRILLDYPSDIMELANQLKIKKFAVLGVSGGGPYAAVCAYKIPHRLTKVGIVVGLAPTYIKGILKGMASASKIGWANYQKIPFTRYISCLFGLLQARYFTFLLPIGFFANQDQALISSRRKEIMLLTRRSAFAQGLKGPELDLRLCTNDWRFDLKKIKTKVYLWYGEADKNVSLAMARYYKQQIANSDLTVYPNEGHLCQITHAEEILRKLVSN